jgi:ABC-type microcin C transport system duplicated ATPase subunit YejF
VGGKIKFEGRNLLDLDENEMTKVRGNRISMIFQQPQSSLNPVFQIGDQIVEVLQIHTTLSKSEAWNKLSSCSGWSVFPMRNEKPEHTRTSCRAGRRSAS